MQDSLLIVLKITASVISFGRDLLVSDRVKVLIVDDNKDFCELLSDFLAKKDDFEIVGVGHNGIEALDILQSSKPDIMVLDIIMPHLDGIGVLEKNGFSRINTKAQDYHAHGHGSGADDQASFGARRQLLYSQAL